MTQNKERRLRARKARFDDVEEIYALVNGYAAKRVMLPKSRVQLYETLRDFYVAEMEEDRKSGPQRNPNRILGCAALHLSWERTGEIRSVAVQREWRGKGVGSVLVAACLNEARELGLTRIFLLTFEPKFFAHSGFQVVDKETLPQKVWTECINCPYYPNCDETAMILNLTVAAERREAPAGGPVAAPAAAPPPAQPEI